MRFEYDFEELPLLTVNGVQTVLTNGTAIIEADTSERTWDVHSIYLDGFDGMKPKPVPLDFKEHQWICFAICDALEKEPFAGFVDRKLDEEIIAAGEEAAERRADARREMERGL